MLSGTSAHVGLARCPLVSASLLCVSLSSALIACSGDGNAVREGGGAPSPAPPASGAPPPGSSEFELAWQDDFDTFDATRWQLMTHSWDTNLAQFSTQNVRV